MKKNYLKTALAAVCVVAAGLGSMKAYNAANQSEADMLLSENVEALSQSEVGGCIERECNFDNGSSCYYQCGSIIGVCSLASNKYL